MYKGQKILAVITARGGSKSVPRKNIKELAGKSLIFYTIEAAKRSTLLTRTIVSTDDQEIADISRSFGAEVSFMRPPELAQDNSISLEVVRHALQWLEENEGEPPNPYAAMILQPTSPLRTAEDIDESIKKLVDSGADSVMSMVELEDFSPKKIKQLGEEDEILPYFENLYEGKQSARRQSVPRAYKRNCAIYLTRTEFIMQNDLFGIKSVAYVMPPERSLDINCESDFALAEFFLRSQQQDKNL